MNFYAHTQIRHHPDQEIRHFKTLKKPPCPFFFFWSNTILVLLVTSVTIDSFCLYTYYKIKRNLLCMASFILVCKWNLSMLLCGPGVHPFCWYVLCHYRNGIYHNILILSTAGRHLHCFQSLAIINKAATSFLVHVFWWMDVFPLRV